MLHRREVRTDFCWVCYKQCETPEGYDPRKHKFVCSATCRVIEQLFCTVHSDETQRAMGMYQEWIKQTGGQ